MTTTNPGVPRVNWPSDSGRFKVVQLYADNEPYMWFDFQKSLHETVFTDILNRLKIRYNEKEKYSKPPLKGRGYRAVGMGYGTVDIGKKLVILSGCSADYGIPVSAEHARRLQRLERDWEFEVTELFSGKAH